MQLRAVQSINDIPAEAWNACAARDRAKPENPFLLHEFLSALEDSGSATERTGWTPMHLVLEQPDGTIEGVVPLYLKSHSQGEYVFDYGWADAYERAGGQYYPKLQCSVPFTPVTGRRLLARRGDGESDRTALLAQGAIEVAKQMGVSSLHLTFLDRETADTLAPLGFLKRTDQQFHWQNKGYAAFDDFLADLASRKRKNIRKERATALAPGIDIEWATGSDLTEDHWEAFYTFYMETGSRKWGRPYLTRTFFSMLTERMADQVLLVMAKRGGRYIAGALNFIGSDTLFGRNWGAVEHHECLHFEACYYQAIDFAIAHGLSSVEAGAQGPHKLARGYMPTETRSAHWIADPNFKDAVARYLEGERSEVDYAINVLSDRGPFRKAFDDEQD